MLLWLPFTRSFLIELNFKNFSISPWYPQFRIIFYFQSHKKFNFLQNNHPIHNLNRFSIVDVCVKSKYITSKFRVYIIFRLRVESLESNENNFQAWYFMSASHAVSMDYDIHYNSRIELRKKSFLGTQNKYKPNI